MFLPSMGEKCIYNNKIYHVQDRDLINGVAKIGIPDTNGIIWDAIWISFENLKMYMGSQHVK
jgi:hypothetical protein